MDDMIKELASLFDNPEKAEQMIRSHVFGSEIIREDRTSVSLYYFHEAHKLAYERREKCGTPHKLWILEFDLRGYSGFSGTVCSSAPQPPNLDDIERQRSGPAYVYRSGHAKR
ncbi:MAG: hypothetical protein KW788_04245 [Candidatus Doudnabacteria bacterium]|nr:hypothetical protein [Candidatus Doudnabacteria bacterium]